MEFSTKASLADKTDCLVVGIFEQQKLSQAAQTLDARCDGLIQHVVQHGDFKGKAGETLFLHRPPCAAQRLLLVGLGKADEQGLSDKNFLDAMGATVRALSDSKVADVLLATLTEPVRQRDLQWQLRHSAQIIASAPYRSGGMKSKQDEAPSYPQTWNFVLPNGANDTDAALQQGQAIAHGINLARQLGDLPPNVCTPSHLAQEAISLAASFDLAVEILEPEAIARAGMGAFLAVAKGSQEEPRFIVLRYQGAADPAQAPIVLVGKGITFDSGGISLKPGADMDEMKYDMCGAASVLGTLRAVAELQLPLNVTVLVPTCENMPSGRATRPGDIVTSLAGKTIEILNTDAEGRLILCDALTYAERFNPDCVIDVATLTGAIVVALGGIASGLMTNDQDLADALLSAGQSAQDRAWQMPLWDDYQEQLKSNFADIPNIGSKGAGSITAACFLARFTENYKWAHLDIAGTAWKSGKDKGATGRPVSLLTHYLLHRAGQL